MPPIIGDEGFAARLKAHPAGVYFFFGEEEFLKRRALARLEALVTENEAFNVRRIDLSSAKDVLSVLTEEIGAVPFLSEYRFTRIDHFAFWQLPEAQAKEVCTLLQNAPEDLILVFFYTAPEAALKAAPGKKTPVEKDAGTRVTGSYVFQNLPENACVVDFKHRSAEFLAGYLKKKCAEKGIAIDSGVALSCVTRCELDLSRIETVFEALIARAKSAGNAVTLEILDEFVEELPEDKVYLLTSALQKKDLNECIRLYQKLRAAKIEPIVLNAAMNKALTQLLAVRSSGGARETQKLLGVSDYPFKLLQQNAKLWTAKELNEGLRLTLRADTLMKNTVLDPDGLIEEIFVRLCIRRKSG